MVEQKIERYSLGSGGDNLDDCLKYMKNELDRGWTVKHMVLTPDMSHVYPQFVVVFERFKEAKNKDQYVD